jgi:hypothetical protein
MKIKVISRLAPEKPTIRRNLNPRIHPLAKAREATRALVAAKWDRVFAKPFVGLIFYIVNFFKELLLVMWMEFGV